MINFDAVDGLRGVVIVLLGFLLIVLGWRYIKAFKQLSLAQRLYIGALQCFILALAWDRYAYIVSDKGYVWSLAPLSIGLMLLFAYLMEPFAQTQTRLGHDPYTPERLDHSEEEARLRLENEELRDRLYEAIQRDNQNMLAMIEMESVIEECRRIEENRKRSNEYS